MADFHHLDDARDIWLAVKARGSAKAMDKVAITLKTKGGLDYLSFDERTTILGYPLKLVVKGAQVKLEKLNDHVKLEESKARFDKWKESSKNLDKLINSSMSSRSKFGLGFGETFGSDERPLALHPEFKCQVLKPPRPMKQLALALVQLTKTKFQTFDDPRIDHHTVSAGRAIFCWLWENHAARPMTRPTREPLFQQFSKALAGKTNSNMDEDKIGNLLTPQQNGVAERKNRTLIEAARTMLADSKLPTMFWTEAGKFPNISHLKPFVCHVTILNTSDHLGKFEGKADEGFIVGYAADSKAYRAWVNSGTQDPHIHAGTQDDSDSECDEQVIVVPSFPSNRFSGPKVHEASEMVENTEEHLRQADMVPAGSIDPAASISAGSAEPFPTVIEPVHADETSLPACSVAQALNDSDWVEAMQEEMQQFINQKVWKLVPLPDGKIAIGTKWILKNKRDARGIVVRNKARLVAQGHRQEEGIDYDEVFAPVARIEAIRQFLAFSSYIGFMIVTTSRYVVPTGRVKVPAGRYVVPTGKDDVIVSAGRSKVIPAGRTILVLVVLCLLKVDSIVS
ncbi:retrovirus-related pol polyprotein from transposon TNT 1-94 [Tanacetum coccineum]